MLCREQLQPWRGVAATGKLQDAAAGRCAKSTQPVDAVQIAAQALTRLRRTVREQPWIDRRCRNLVGRQRRVVDQVYVHAPLRQRARDAATCKPSADDGDLRRRAEGLFGSPQGLT